MLTELQKLSCICCGATLERKNGKLVCTHCKSTFDEVEKISEEEVVALNRATTDRNLLRFDEAWDEYLLLLKNYPENEAGNWGALLCDYGIIYEEDYNGEYLPTCHRLNERPVSESYFYKKLNAEHKKKADEIEKLRLAIADKADKVKPYDVFICYKATEEKRGMAFPTQEASWGRDIYELLTRKGLRVFFAEKSLQESNIEYEPHIYAALRTAKLMFVLAGNIEHVKSTWVANEWKRYAKYIRDGENKALRVVYDNINAYDLPKELQATQAINHNSMGWGDAVEKAASDIFTPKQEKSALELELEAMRAQLEALKKEQKAAKPKTTTKTTTPKTTAAAPKTTATKPKTTTQPQMSAQQLTKVGDDYYFGKNGKSKNYATAANYYYKAAQMGHADAQNNLAICYKDGLGVQVNYYEAARWFQAAAQQGNHHAIYNLATCYHYGRGVQVNYYEAVRLYKIAAEKGNVMAMNSMGYCNENAIGLPRNMQYAVQWYKMAADRGNKTAEQNLQRLGYRINRY